MCRVVNQKRKKWWLKPALSQFSNALKILAFSFIHSFMGERIGESEMEELVPEWGWRRDKSSCDIVTHRELTCMLGADNDHVQHMSSHIHHRCRRVLAPSCCQSPTDHSSESSGTVLPLIWYNSVQVSSLWSATILRISLHDPAIRQYKYWRRKRSNGPSLNGRRRKN